MTTSNILPQIDNKTCSKCGEIHPLSVEFFHKVAANKDGFSYHCQVCVKKNRAAHYQANKESIKAASLEYYRNNKDAVLARLKDGYHTNPEAIRQRVREYRDRNPDKIQALRVARYETHKDVIKAQASQYYKKNKDKVQLSQADWRDRNKHRVQKYGFNYREKIKADPLLVLQYRYRQMVSRAWRGNGYDRTSRSHKILGCSWEEFKNHIERQFTKGMDWGRINDMHLDHVIPLSSAKTVDDLIALNHYTNLRPLWAKDNLSKGSKLEYLI